MMGIGRGAALVYTQGRPISGLPKLFVYNLAGNIFGMVPKVVPVVLIVYFASYIVLRYSLLGLQVYATGGNETAAFLSGIPTKMRKLQTYVICGGLSSLSGLLLTARLNSAQPVLGIGYELDAIGAVVIGGTSLFGGEGRITGTLVGALIMGIVRNGLNLMNVSSYLQQIVIGVVLIGAVAISVLRATEKKK
jgi:ribose/xylose/arabinose/galactoside ABC-type transport system permease subunit